MNLTTSSANIIQGMTDEGEHLVLITNFHFIIYMQKDISFSNNNTILEYKTHHLELLE